MSVELLFTTISQSTAKPMYYCTSSDYHRQEFGIFSMSEPLPSNGQVLLEENNGLIYPVRDEIVVLSKFSPSRISTKRDFTTWT